MSEWIIAVPHKRQTPNEHGIKIVLSLAFELQNFNN